MSPKAVFTLFMLSVLLLGSTIVMADGGVNTIVYPEKNPVFSVTFPDNWSTETDENLLHATPDDSSIYLGIWALEEANDLDAALDAVDEVVSSLVKNLQVDEADSMVVNGIQFITVDGTGKDDEGDNVNVSAALFSPMKNRFSSCCTTARPTRRMPTRMNWSRSSNPSTKRNKPKTDVKCSAINDAPRIKPRVFFIRCDPNGFRRR